MPLKRPPRRHYTHKEPAKHFLKVYHPYLPLLLFVLVFLGAGWAGFKQIRPTRGVLSYTTNASINSLLSATNEARNRHERAELSLNLKLNEAAQAKAQDMANRNYWSHKTPDGNEPWYFYEQVGYEYLKAGENLAYGFSSSKATVAGWMNSPSHRDNLLETSFREVGFGIANAGNYQESGNQTIIVALYANPATDTATTAVPHDNSNPLQTTAGILSAAEEPPSRQIAAIQALTGGIAPWSNFALGILMGAGAVFIVLKHGLGFKKFLKKSELYLLHHPLFDALVIALILLSLLLRQTAGLVR